MNIKAPSFVCAGGAAGRGASALSPSYREPECDAEAVILGGSQKAPNRYSPWQLGPEGIRRQNARLSEGCGAFKRRIWHPYRAHDISVAFIATRNRDRPHENSHNA